MIFKLEDIKEGLRKFRSEGLPQGKKTGWPGLDELYRPEKKYFTIITGIPMHGKTQFLNALQINLSIMHGWKHATFSPESFPIESHFNEYAQILCGKATADTGDAEYGYAEDWIDEHFHFIYPKDEERTIDHILGYVKECIDGWGCDSFTIDPWNELDHRRETYQSETEYTSQVLSKIRSFCRENNVHGFLVAHPTKLQKDPKGNYPVPTLYDIAGSAHFRNKTDYGIVVHRHDLKLNEPTVYVQKMKFKNFGKIGDLKMCYERKSGRLAEEFRHFSLPGKAKE
jgi:twinkle protein